MPGIPSLVFPFKYLSGYKKINCTKLKYYHQTHCQWTWIKKHKLLPQYVLPFVPKQHGYFGNGRVGLACFHKKQAPGNQSQKHIPVRKCSWNNLMGVFLFLFPSVSFSSSPGRNTISYSPLLTYRWHVLIKTIFL